MGRTGCLHQSYALNVRWLDPHLGHHRLDALKPAHIQAAYGALLHAGLGARTAERAHTVLHTGLWRAVKLEIIARNPTEAVAAPRPVRTEMRTLSPEEIQILFADNPRDRLRALWVLLVTTGLRVGEATGLKWGDIDLEHASLTVKRSLQRQKHKGPVFVGTKTERSRRTVLLAPHTVAALRAHRKRQVEQRLRLGSEWREVGLVFTNTTGGPLDAGSVRESLGRRLKDAGLPQVRVHDLRHTAATYLLSQGVHPKVVQDMLGHSTITLTLDTYSHVIPALHREAAERMDAVFG